MSDSKGTVLVTGGAGYVGSHAVVELIAAGYEVVILDSLCNSKAEVVDRIEAIGGVRPVLYVSDVRNYRALREIFEAHAIHAVMHFAALKAVSESVSEPIRYYRNNINSAMTLCQVMEEFDVKRLIFSSSATVYGAGAALPLTESAPLGPTNPYGRAKLMVEEILRDIAQADASWRICALRYFNPVGAHESALIGEDPTGVPNNLMPYVCQVAVGRRKALPVYGADYPTVDGTGLRDYIHIVDLARGHVAALQNLCDLHGMMPVNLGTGRGHTVLEVVRAFEKISGRKIPINITDRREGDVAASYADPALAHRLLSWKAERTLTDMCRDAWRWQERNPQGYTSDAGTAGLRTE